MKKFFSKIVYSIIPHEKNNNIPHILRAEVVLVLVVFAGVLFYFNQNNFKIIEKLNLTATVYPAVLADLANKDRLDSGVSGLAWSNTLEKAAKLKAEDMLKNGYFAHVSPTGVSPWHWLGEAGYNFLYAGENLAIDFSESENVERAWINSPTHKENIINKNFTEIGIATAEGVYKGKNTTVVVEFFGEPLKFTDKEVPSTTTKLSVVEEKEGMGGKVAGASTENPILPEEKQPKVEDKFPNIKIIEETDKLIVVQNDISENKISENVNSSNDIAQTDVSNGKNTKVSTWYERFIVSPTNTIVYIYITILGLVLIATILMLKKEYQEHHKKHLIFGFVLIFLIIILICVISANNLSLIL